MTQANRARRAFTPGSVRLAALVLAALTLCAAFLTRPARAAEWMQPYLEQVQEWGVMRGDANGNLNEDRSITRAEFVTLVNRAFGYTDAGPNPFSDVPDNAWYAEDIRIAYKAGYFQGTSAATASPMNLVTREQAAVLLGRCLRFQGVAGAANSTFTDMPDIGGWSRGLVQEAADLGIIQGYADGSFRPHLPITRGQMACFLVRALGTLVQEPGEQTSGGVYGNLTITTPGVKLKDTVVTGNLYLTGGVGLGSVELENVNVLGRIVLCGTGEAESGKNSVILRNVSAASLDVDSLTDQFLSIQAEGLTDIKEMAVRTSAYIEDRTGDSLGFQTLRLDGADGARFQLAGNIKRVVNVTPNSTVQVAQGVTDIITMDEKAAGASLSIDGIASIRELNLDAAARVTGEGGISRLNVNAAGSNVAMLPDTVFVRPGITGTIHNVNMDNKAAEESSEDPRILAGYPAARNVAPTSADAVFRTNKTGTIHWAVTALMDGSVGEEELMTPASYPKIFRSGTINATASNRDFTARLTGLTREGSYYISAMLVDARGRRSPVKVAAFTTPDDSVPNFANGYPQAPVLTTDADGEQVAQIMVMPTKSCQMYYVLLPTGSTAPTAADFRSAALPGNLGYGVVTLRKNTPFLVSRINTSHLQEKTNYDLYLWLNDADNGKSSAVRRVTVTTRDITPPAITSLTVGTPAARAVPMRFSLDEPGSLYWVVVKHGVNFYASGVDKNNPNQTAKIQIMNGTGANVVRRGGPIRAARGGTEYTFTVAGLESQTTYDLYYVAVDTAGNYCVYSAPLIPPMEIHTLDEEDPTVTQEFTNGGTGPASHPTPYPDTSVSLVFSETVLPLVSNNGMLELKDPNFDTAFQDAQDGDAAKQMVFANLLKDHIKLYRKPVTGRVELVSDEFERTANNEASIGDNWIIDYRYATISRDSDSGEMLITFPYNKAIKLGSGDTYYFVVSNVADSSNNRMKNSGNNRDGYQLPDFTVVDVEVDLSRTTTLEAIIGGEPKKIDMAFELDSPTASSANASTKWDMLIWYTAPVPAASSVEFELYYSDNGSGWIQAGDPGKTATIQTFTGEERTGISVGKHFNNYDFETLQTLRQREYGIKIVKVGTSSDEADWSFPITFEIRIVAADQGALRELATPDLTPKLWDANQASDVAVKSISKPVPFTVTHTFSDQNPPRFINNYPQFIPSDESVDITIMLNRSATTCYYVIAPLNTIPTTYDGSPIRTPTEWETLEQDGFMFNNEGDKGLVTSPLSNDIMNPQYPNSQIKTGSIGFSSGATNIPTIRGLLTNKEYIAYFVLRGEGLNTYSGVYAFRFKTDPINRPILHIDLSAPKATITEVNNRDANGGWMLFPDTDIPQQLQDTVGDNLNIGTAEEDPRYTGIWAQNSASWSGLTLLEAMQREVRDGNEVVGTIFDLYVLKDIQDRVGDNIVRGTYNGQNGSLTLNAQRRALDQNYTQWMSPGVNYYLVAAAKNPQGSAYGCAAAYRLYSRDTEHPKISGIATSAGKFYDNSLEARNAEYTGVMQILFDETLYWKASEEANTISKLANALSPSTAVNPLPSGTPSNVTNYQSVMALLNPGPLGLDSKNLDKPASGSPYPDCTVLYFTFENLKMNTPISLNTSSLCDVSSNAGFGDRNIQLQLELARTPDGAYTAQFVVTSGNATSWFVNSTPSYSYPRVTA